MARVVASIEHLLDLLGRYLKIDTHYLASGGFWLTAGQVVSSATTLVLAITLANILPKEIFGTYKYLLSLVALFAIFTLPGLTTALSRDVAKGFEQSFFNAFRTRLTWGLVGSVCCYITALYYAMNGNMVFAGSLLVGGTALPFFEAWNLYGAYLQGKKSFRTSFLLFSFTQLVSTSALIAAAYTFGNTFALIATYFVAFGLTRYICFWIVRRTIPSGATGSTDTVPYGKHLTAVDAISIAATQADALVLFQIAGPATLAIYAIALAPTEQMRAFFSFVDTLLFPRFSIRSRADVLSNLIWKCVLLFGVAALAVVAYVILAPYFFAFFFPRYLDAIFPSQLYSLLILTVAFMPASSFLKSHGMVREIYSSTIITTIVQLTTMLLFTFWYGLIGLIAARIVSRFFGGLLTLYYAYRPHRV